MSAKRSPSPSARKSVRRSTKRQAPMTSPEVRRLATEFIENVRDKMSSVALDEGAVKALQEKVEEFIKKTLRDAPTSNRTMGSRKRKRSASRKSKSRRLKKRSYSKRR
jgi:hypothetical protein